MGSPTKDSELLPEALIDQARELAYLAGCHAPESRLLGNMRADEIARVAMALVRRLEAECDS